MTSLRSHLVSAATPRRDGVETRIEYPPRKSVSRQGPGRAGDSSRFEPDSSFDYTAVHPTASRFDAESPAMAVFRFSKSVRRYRQSGPEKLSHLRWFTPLLVLNPI